MIRTTAAAFAILLSTSLFAGDSQQYLVATKRPFGHGALKQLRESIAAGDVRGFRHAFNGFAATLTEAEVAALRASSEVRWIEPVIERYAVVQARNTNGQTMPYGVDLVHAPDAWAGRRVDTVNVAVLDTGIDYRHPELAEYYAGGYNLFNRDATPLDDGGHGTHVAGTIAAADNNVGVVGLAPGIRLWAVKVLNSAGAGNTGTIVGGIDWVIAKKAEVGGNWIINLSLGSPNASNAEREAVDRATAAGILIVAASGNESIPTAKAPVIYPAAYPAVVAVGAIDDTETVASFSNQGPELDLVAPGVAVLSTVPVNSNFVSTIVTPTRSYYADALANSAPGRIDGEFVYCALGLPGQFPPAVRGRVAVIKRGEITFANKAFNAYQAGATAVVIFNDVNTQIATWTLISGDDPWSWEYEWQIPVVGTTRADGEALIKDSGAIVVTVDPDDYAFYSGTSMASPHVAGAAALLWAFAPQAKPADLVNALTGTAIDRGPRGYDPAYGAGVLNVFAAAQRLAPYAFDSQGPTTGRPIGKRGRG